MKTCYKCKEEKSKDLFSSTYCKVCAKKYRSEHYGRNKEKVSSQVAAWRNNNREKYLTNSRIKNNLPKNVAYRRSEEYKARAREYNKTPERRAKLTERQRLREAGIRLSEISLSNIEKIRIENIYQFSREASFVTGSAHHVDHKIPLSKGGNHHPDNLVVIPALVNMRKGNRI